MYMYSQLTLRFSLDLSSLNLHIIVSCHNIFCQLTEGLLGQATVLTLQGDMLEAKKFLIRAQELAIEVLGARHHFVAAIINKV